MNELLKIKYVKSDKDVVGLRQLYDMLEVHVRSLLSLDADSQSYGTLLFPYGTIVSFGKANYK